MIFLLGFYCFYQPDNLIKFVPQNTFIYFHLDLNNYSKKGEITQQWLGKKYLENSFSDQSLIKSFFKKENYKFFNQLALIVPFNQEKNSIDPALFLAKTKKGVSLDEIIVPIRNQGFFIEKINSKICLISQQPIFLEKNGFFPQQKSFSWSDFMPSPVFTGFFNLEFWSKHENNLIKFKAFSLKEKEVFINFETENLIDLNSITFNKEFFSLEEIKKKFVLAYPIQDKNLETIKKNIKELVAWQNPVKQEKILPDQTVFNELIVDPNLFEFKEKQIESQNIFYLEEEWGFGDNLFLWTQKTNSFISNDLELTKKFIKEDLIFQREPCFKQALYFDLNQTGLRKMFLVQTEKETKTWLIFD